MKKNLTISIYTSKAGNVYYCLNYGYGKSVVISPKFSNLEDGSVNKKEWAKFFDVVTSYLDDVESDRLKAELEKTNADKQ